MSEVCNVHVQKCDKSPEGHMEFFIKICFLGREVPPYHYHYHYQPINMYLTYVRAPCPFVSYHLYTIPQWGIRKRYSDFLHFDEYLRRTGISVDYRLPPKNWWSRFDPTLRDAAQGLAVVHERAA